MDYVGNIEVSPTGEDLADLAMGGMVEPYLLPNPTNADKTTPHDPTTKGDAPPNYQVDHGHKISFGSGLEAEDLTFAASSTKQGQSSFTDLIPGEGPTPAGGEEGGEE